MAGSAVLEAKIGPHIARAKIADGQTPSISDPLPRQVERPVV
jgi:hypothetical protein